MAVKKGSGHPRRTLERPATVLALIAGRGDPLARAATTKSMTVEDIKLTAGQICQQPTLYGYTRNASGELSGKLSLPAVTRLFANAGVNATLKGGVKDWNGIAQSDAAKAVADANACRERMFTLLFQHFYQPITGTPPKASQGTVSKPANRRATPKPPRVAETGTDEAAGRTQRGALLAQITRAYMAEHDGITGRMMAGLELAPVEYLNTELARQGMRWRVLSVQGAQAQTYDLDPPNPKSSSVTVQNSPGSIVAPTGGTNTVINQAPPPTVTKLSENPTTQNTDGSFTRTLLVEVAAPVAPQNIAFFVKGPTVLDIAINGVGSGPAIRAGSGKTPDGWYWYAFSLPTAGRFNVGARTKDKDTPFDVIFRWNVSIG